VSANVPYARLTERALDARSSASSAGLCSVMPARSLDASASNVASLTCHPVRLPCPGAIVSTPDGASILARTAVLSLARACAWSAPPMRIRPVRCTAAPAARMVTRARPPRPSSPWPGSRAAARRIRAEGERVVQVIEAGRAIAFGRLPALRTDRRVRPHSRSSSRPDTVAASVVQTRRLLLRWSQRARSARVHLTVERASPAGLNRRPIRWPPCSSGAFAPSPDAA